MAKNEEYYLPNDTFVRSKILPFRTNNIEERSLFLIVKIERCVTHETLNHILDPDEPCCDILMR